MGISLGGMVAQDRKIGIVGYGHIGHAVQWAHRHDQIIINDPAYSESKPLSEFKNLDAIYICVPSPSNSDGSCNSEILKNVLKDLYFTNLTSSTVIISHTTAPPSVYQELLKLYPNLVHAPEFITERDAIRDYQNMLWGIFGGNLDWTERARDINRTVRNLKYDYCFLVDIESASLYKYFSNSFLATKVSIATEWKQLADQFGIDWDIIAWIASSDTRIGSSHLTTPGYDGLPGWAGSCFPKDISAIINEADSNSVDFKLLKFVQNLNNLHRGINDKSI